LRSGRVDPDIEINCLIDEWALNSVGIVGGSTDLDCVGSIAVLTRVCGIVVGTSTSTSINLHIKVIGDDSDVDVSSVDGNRLFEEEGVGCIEANCNWGVGSDVFGSKTENVGRRTVNSNGVGTTSSVVNGNVKLERAKVLSIRRIVSSNSNVVPCIDRPDHATVLIINSIGEISSTKSGSFADHGASRADIARVAVGVARARKSIDVTPIYAKVARSSGSNDYFYASCVGWHPEGIILEFIRVAKNDRRQNIVVRARSNVSH